MPKHNSWGTAAEKDFIDTLSFDKLAKYKDTIRLRTRWGDIKKGEVKRYAARRLNILRRGIIERKNKTAKH